MKNVIITGLLPDGRNMDSWIPACWIAGLTAFGLFFLYDWNRISMKKGWMKPFFTAGCLLLLPVGLRLTLLAWTEGGRLWLIPAFAFLAALIHTLFFALPFDDTYRQDAGGHRVCRTGVYGWCRHPGIWWFFGFFLCLGLACRQTDCLLLCLGLPALNLGYAWYQDRFIFIQEFSDYGDYRKSVPFLIPRRPQRREPNDDI